MTQPNKERLDQLLTVIKSGTDKDALLSACEALIVEDEFFQWEGTAPIRMKREANKHYFREKQGIQTVVNLVKSNEDELVKRFGVDVLWAYSETDENRRELLDCGVLPLIMDCLKTDSAKVQEGAVGALWQLLEYYPIQLESVKAGLAEPLLNLLTTSKITRTQTRAAGCLHLISWNESCREALVRLNALEKILSIETTALMVNYFRLLAAANLLLLPDHESLVPPATMNGILGQITRFIVTETPENVRSIEDRLMYIWVSTRPYVPLVYSRHKEIFLLGMFALANLTYKAENRRLLESEELRDKVICLTWTPMEEAKVYADTIRNNMKSVINGKGTWEPPALYAIAYNYLNNQHHREGYQIAGLTRAWRELFLR